MEVAIVTEQKGRLPKRGLARGVLAAVMVFLVFLAVQLVFPDLVLWWIWIPMAIAGVLAYQGRI